MRVVGVGVGVRGTPGADGPWCVCTRPCNRKNLWAKGPAKNKVVCVCVCVCQSVVEYHQCVWILDPMCDALLARLIGRLERILEYFRVRILARLELWLEDD